MSKHKGLSVTVVQTPGSGLRLDPAGAPKIGLWAKIARFNCRFRATPNHMHRRREAPIHAYVGKNGSGKTLAAVRDSTPTLAGIPWSCDLADHHHTQAGITSGYRKVLSTVRILDPETGEDHPLYERFWHWDQFKHAEHCDVIMDEMTGVAHSRESSGLPPEIMLILNQLRKRDTTLRWTAPAWARADKLIRECTNAVTMCYGSYPQRGGDISLWLPNRRFRYLTYDTSDFDEFTSGKRNKLTPDIQEFFWGPDSNVFRMYNSQDAVTRLGQTSDAGICVGCGGTRRRQECTCEEYQARKPARGKKAAAPAFVDEHAGHVPVLVPAES